MFVPTTVSVRFFRSVKTWMTTAEKNNHNLPPPKKPPKKKKKKPQQQQQKTTTTTTKNKTKNKTNKQNNNKKEAKNNNKKQKQNKVDSVHAAVILTTNADQSQVHTFSFTWIVIFIYVWCTGRSSVQQPALS